MNNDFDMTGKSVLITGGGTGIGLAMARALASSGAAVMLAARREDVLKSAAETLMAEPGIDSVLWHPVDLADRDSVKALSEHATRTFGGVDVFIGNAGFEIQQGIDDITDEALDNQIRVNLTANIELTRDLLPSMRRKKWGRVIYSSSDASLLASAGDLMSVYATVKSGLNGFCRYVAAEAGRDGVTANALILGFFLTEMVEKHMHVDNLHGEMARQLFLVDYPAMMALGRPAQPREIGGMVQLLASDAGSYITGACLPVDGGMSIMLRPNPVSSEVASSIENRQP